MMAARVSGTQKPLLAPSGVRPRWSTQGAIMARNTRERKRASSTSRAGSRKSEANGDGPVPSGLTIRRRRKGAASGEARSSPKSGKMSAAWALNSPIISAKAAPSPGREPFGLGDVRLHVAEEDGGLAVRQRDAGRAVGVEIAQTALGQLRPELGVGLRGDEQGVGARIDVVAEPGNRQLLGPHQTAHPVVPLQHQHAPPRAGKIGGGDQRVVAAADENRVELLHVVVPPCGAGG